MIADGHLGCFRFSFYSSSFFLFFQAVLWTFLHMSSWYTKTNVSLWYIFRSGIVGLENKYSFHSMLIASWRRRRRREVTVSPAVYGRSHYSTSKKSLVWSDLLVFVYMVDVKYCLIKVKTFFVITYKAEYLFICLLPFIVSFCVKWPFMSFANFLFWLLRFVAYVCCKCHFPGCGFSCHSLWRVVCYLLMLVIFITTCSVSAPLTRL